MNSKLAIKSSWLLNSTSTNPNPLNFPLPYGVNHMYNETLHDRSGSFLYQNIASTKLSEASIDAIRSAFPNWCDLWHFIRSNVCMSNLECWEIIDTVYPEVDQD